MNVNHSIVGKNINCGDRGLSFNTWAEEPPVYHLFGVLLLNIFNSLFFLKVLPFMLFAIFIIGIKYSYEAFFKEELEYKYCSLLFFIPFIYVHLTRSLPDILAITFLIWFFYFWLKDKLNQAFLLAILAVTTKVLAIFPIFFIMGHFLLFSNEKSFAKRLSIGLFFSLSLIPTIAWFYFLYANKINNPFFENQFSGFHHLNSHSDVILYYKRKFWSKILTWVIIRGISLPFALIIIWGIFKRKISQISFLMSMFVGHMVYIIITNSMQVSAPWYSFYFLFVYLLFALKVLVNINYKIQKLIMVLIILHSFTMIDYSTNIKNNIYFEDLPKLSAIPCDFHEYYKHAKNMIVK